MTRSTLFPFLLSACACLGAAFAAFSCGAGDTAAEADAMAGADASADASATASDEDLPPCCETDAEGTAAAEPLPETSVYQLDGAWHDQDGAERHLRDFRGEVVVVAMIFTHCEYACPAILADLRDLEARLDESQRAATRFLLVSMDSARDEPPVLRAYAERQNLDLDRWTLLHGEPARVREIAAVLGVRYKQAPDGSFAHSNLITVLDRDGEIAGRVEGLHADLAPAEEAVRAATRAEP